MHPDSWQPIDFDDYLKRATLHALDDRQVVGSHSDPAYLGGLPLELQCQRYLDAPPVAPSRPAPVYIQVYRDASPLDSDDRDWIYIKYNVVFDWSGLAFETGWLPRLAAMLSGGDARRWHRLDIHVSAILAFDGQRRLRLLSLAQHNYQRTYLAGRDFSSRAAIHSPALPATWRRPGACWDSTSGVTVPLALTTMPSPPTCPCAGWWCWVTGRRKIGPWLRHCSPC
ncbi:MAG TPA: hypothetical protein ENK48_01675 [Gammaproteobacteria bacterium]|nr:hypothetical protein [Gammaproteobacteria bacterium]